MISFIKEKGALGVDGVELKAKLEEAKEAADGEEAKEVEEEEEEDVEHDEL